VKLHPAQAHRLRIERYVAPGSIDEALAVLAESDGRARLIAGGTDLLLEMGRGQRPDLGTLIDLTRVAGLDEIALVGDYIEIGATVTHGRVASSPLVVEHALPLAQACLEIASPQLRNRATIVGNVVTASPANDTITPLRALGTTLVIASPGGQREAALASFHTGVRQINLGPDEMVLGLRVRAMRASERGVFVKLGLRKAQAISVIHLAIVLDFAGSTVRAASIALGSVAPTIIEAARAQVFLVGRELDSPTVEEASRLVGAAATPIDDIRASADYRSEMLAVLCRRALQSLASSTERDAWPPRVVTLAGRSGGRYPTGPSHALAADAATDITANVNGSPLTASTGPGTLLDWLRDAAGLTGSKEGCAEGECGACTVFLDGMAVMSCLVPAGRGHGAEIVTIEGLAGVEGLHPLQQAFLDQGAVQCGFCIPGFIMSGAKLLEEASRPTVEDVKAALSGNLCRCTGYYKILAAVEQASSTTPRVPRPEQTNTTQ
jgi:xanthine dehydrogenase iron-sulfur cluster and FAD-binding subunit A